MTLPAFFLSFPLMPQWKLGTVPLSHCDRRSYTCCRLPDQRPHLNPVHKRNPTPWLIAILLKLSLSRLAPLDRSLGLHTVWNTEVEGKQSTAVQSRGRRVKRFSFHEDNGAVLFCSIVFHIVSIKSLISWALTTTKATIICSYISAIYHMTIVF